MVSYRKRTCECQIYCSLFFFFLFNDDLEHVLRKEVLFSSEYERGQREQAPPFGFQLGSKWSKSALVFFPNVDMIQRRSTKMFQ